MVRDSNHHLEAEIAAPREENAHPRAELYVKQSEYTESSNLASTIVNNAAERAMRPVTIGRKNWLCISDSEAGRRSAILYAMMKECKRCKVDRLAWMTRVQACLPNYRGDYRNLYPSAMPKQQEQGKERSI